MHNPWPSLDRRKILAQDKPSYSAHHPNLLWERILEIGPKPGEQTIQFFKWYCMQMHIESPLSRNEKITNLTQKSQNSRQKSCKYIMWKHKLAHFIMKICTHVDNSSMIVRKKSGFHKGTYELTSKLYSLHSPQDISEWSWLLFCFSLDMPFVHGSINYKVHWSEVHETYFLIVETLFTLYNIFQNATYIYLK